MLEGGNLVEHDQADIKVTDVDLILPLCFNDDESLIWPGLLFSTVVKRRDIIMDLF